LETVIPDVPKKSERIAEPDENAHNAEAEKIEKEINAIKTKMSDMIKTERGKLGLSGKESSTEQRGLKDLLKAKQQEFAKVQGDLATLYEQMDTLKKGLEDYYEKSHKLRNKMKIIMSADKMQAELQALKDKQSKGNITMFEEKKVVRQIAELEASLPYAEPLQLLEEQYAGVKTKKKGLSDLITKAKDTRERFRAEEKDLRAMLNKKKEASDKLYDEKVPAIEKIKDEYKVQVKDLKQKIRDLEHKHNEQWERYEAQQELIREIQWMKKIQDRLKRDAVRKAREEEDRKVREVEEAQFKDTPYREEMELCDLLLAYLNKLLPHEQAIETEQGKDKSELLQEALKSDAWKKEKVQLVVARKDLDNDLFAAKPKKKAQEKKANAAQGPVNLPLNHQMEILGYFDHIKVAPPLATTKLADAIKLLKEKKDYYKVLSEKEEKGEKTEPAKEEVKAEDSPKKGSAKKQHKPFSVNEEDFPVMK